jgi:DNA repair protein RadA
MDNIDTEFETGEDVLKKRVQVGRITTSSTKLDELLGGGIETQAITEVYGEFATGKTQIAHQTAVTVQLHKEEGGLNARSIYVDTENTFRPERIIQIAEYAGKDPKDVLRNILVGRAWSSDQQIELVKEVGKIENESNVGLLIIDSITSHFRSEYLGREMLPKRQQDLNQHLHTLQDLADRHNLAVLATNQVIARVDDLIDKHVDPVGGNIMAHQSTHRIYLRKAKANKRIARLVDSPLLPEAETVFCIGEGGITDQ